MEIGTLVPSQHSVGKNSDVQRSLNSKVQKSSALQRNKNDSLSIKGELLDLSFKISLGSTIEQNYPHCKFFSSLSSVEQIQQRGL